MAHIKWCCCVCCRSSLLMVVQSAVSTLPALTLTFTDLSCPPVASAPSTVVPGLQRMYCVCRALAAKHCRSGVHSSFSAHARRVCRVTTLSQHRSNCRTKEVYRYGDLTGVTNHRCVLDYTLLYLKTIRWLYISHWCKSSGNSGYILNFRKPERMILTPTSHDLLRLVYCLMPTHFSET